MKNLFNYQRPELGRAPRATRAGRAIGFSLAETFLTCTRNYLFSAKAIAAIPHAGLLLLSGAVGAQTPVDSLQVQQLDEVVVSGIRAHRKSPIAFSNVSQDEIKTRNLGQDIPALLNYLPSVVMTSDAGAGIGYSTMRVRGSDATRINVTLNGIPYNDAESHGTFWVNLPDFASSTRNLQLQRGVGTSTNGSGAFGASLNLLTDGISREAYAETAHSIGSFATRKHTVKFSTGALGERFELAGRLSQINSDGYIDRASSDLKSYFLQGTYQWGGTQLKALVFGGKEKTYQAWNGLEDLDLLENDRTFNPAGMYTDDNGNIQFYDNQTDNYQQDHYQLHWVQNWGNDWRSHAALHWTKGEGYYENYRVNRSATDYGLTPVTLDGEFITRTDLVDQKWLRNDFYGAVYHVNYQDANWDVILGGGLHRYVGDHFGDVIWARSLPMGAPRIRYYEDDARKDDVNGYLKATYSLGEKWQFYGDLQLRQVAYKANGDEIGLVDDSFRFFNPKAGITYTRNEQNQWYASYGRSHREPNRVDYENGAPRPERLDDLEFGWRYTNNTYRLSINAFCMLYQDQLVLTGALNDVGNPIRTNSGKSDRTGIEIEAAVPITPKISWLPNLTWSNNRNRNFYYELDGQLTNLGDTRIAFSPQFVATNGLVWTDKTWFFGLFSKYVSEQYMGNIDAEASKLDAYFTTDVNVAYSFKNTGIFKEITVSLLVNNLFDYRYESNGYFYTYDDDWSTPGSVQTVYGAGYYPQAGINWMGGILLKL